MSFDILTASIAAILSLPPIVVAIRGRARGELSRSFAARHARACALVAMGFWAVCIEMQFWTGFSVLGLVTSLIGVSAVAAALIIHADHLRGEESGESPS